MKSTPFTREQNPWFSFKPYQESDAHSFKGRSQDITAMMKLLTSNDCVVCYAKSGIGKSSLINAGLVPRLRRKLLFPVFIRFTEDFFADNDFDTRVCTQINQVIENLNKKAKEAGRDEEYAIQPSAAPSSNKVLSAIDKQVGSSIWWWLRTHDIICRRGIFETTYHPIFIFDQFEEFFYKAQTNEQKEIFFNWMRDLILNQPTENVKAIIHEIQARQALSKQSLLHEGGAKVLVSLREDFVGQLDYWCSQRVPIIALQDNRYCLMPLTEQQAEEVITEQTIDGEPVTLLNDYKKVIIDSLLEADGIAAVLLSVLCNRIFDEEVTGHANTKDELKRLSDNKEESNVESPDDPIKLFVKSLVRKVYEERLTETKLPLQNIERVEEALVKNGFRKRVYLTDLPEVLQSTCIKLSDYYLVRIENHGKKNGQTIQVAEIIHDRIADVIQERQQERKMRQEEKKGTRKTILLRTAAVLAVFAMAWCTIYFGVNVRKNSSAVNDLTRINTLELTTEDSEWLNQGVTMYNSCTLRDNSLVEKFTITGDSNRICIKDCYLLKSIEVKGFSKDTLFLKVIGCPQLMEIKVLGRVRFLDYSIQDCPKAQIFLNRWVEDIYFDTFGESSMTFKVDDNNPNFLWRNNILWDLNPEYERIIYAQGSAPTQVAFPPSYQKNRLWCSNAQKYFENSRLSTSHDGDSILYINKKYIEASMIPNRGVQEVFLGDSVHYICVQAFKGCKQLRRVHFPKHRLSIFDEAFADCSSLDSVIFEGDTVHLRGRAFTGCQSLHTMRLPGEVQVDTLVWHGSEIVLGKLFEYRYKLLSYIDNPFMECPSNFCPQIKEGGNLVEENGIIFLRDSHIPIFVKADAPAYNHGDFFTEQGSLFVGRKSIGGLCWLSSKPEERSKQVINSIIGASYSPEALFLSNLVLPQPGTTTITLPSRIRTTYYFPTNTSQLQAIHIPFPQPEGMRDARGKKIPTTLDFDLPDSLKERITLYVPVGSKAYYENSVRFKAFKAIREEGTANDVYLRFARKLFEPIALDFSRYWFICVGFPLLAIGIGLFIFWLRRKQLSHPTVPTHVNRRAAIFALVYVLVAALLYVVAVTWCMVFTSMSDTYPIYAGNLYHIPTALFSLGGAALLMYAPELTRWGYQGWLSFMKWIKDKTAPLVSVGKKVSAHWKEIAYATFFILAAFFVCGMILRAHSPEEAMRQGDFNRAAQLFANRFIKADTITAAEQKTLRSLLIKPLCIPGVPDSTLLEYGGYGGGENNDFTLQSNGYWHHYNLTTKTIISIPQGEDGFERSESSPTGHYRILRPRKEREMARTRSYSSSSTQLDTIVLFSASARRDTLWPVANEQWLDNERYLLSFTGPECLLFETSTGKLRRSWKGKFMKKPLYDEKTNHLFISVQKVDSIGINYYSSVDTCMVEEIDLNNWKTYTYPIQGMPAYVVQNSYSQTDYLLVTKGATIIRTGSSLYEIMEGNPMSITMEGDLVSILCDGHTNYFLCNTQTDAVEYRLQGSSLRQTTLVRGRFIKLNDEYALVQNRDSLGWHFYQVKTGKLFPVPVPPVNGLRISPIRGTDAYMFRNEQTSTSYLIKLTPEGPRTLLTHTGPDGNSSGNHYFSLDTSSDRRWGLGWDKDTTAVVMLPAQNDYDDKKRRFVEGFYREWDEARKSYHYTPLSGKEDYDFYSPKIPWKVLDGWIVMNVDNHQMQLINIMSLRRLIKESTLLTDKQKQALLQRL